MTFLIAKFLKYCHKIIIILELFTLGQPVFLLLVRLCFLSTRYFLKMAGLISTSIGYHHRLTAGTEMDILYKGLLRARTYQVIDGLAVVFVHKVWDSRLCEHICLCRFVDKRLALAHIDYPACFYGIQAHYKSTPVQGKKP